MKDRPAYAGAPIPGSEPCAQCEFCQPTLSGCVCLYLANHWRIRNLSLLGKIDMNRLGCVFWIERQAEEE